MLGSRFPSVVTLVGLLAPLVAIGLATPGCSDEIDMTRPEFERGTLGEEIYRVLHRDLARTRSRSAQKAAAFEALQSDFIWAVDTMAPEGEVDAVDQFLIDILPLYDDDSFPDLIRKVAFVFDDLAASESVRAAWVRSDREKSAYMRAEARTDLLEHLFAYPQLRDITRFTTDLVLQHDGVDDYGNPAPDENDYIYRLLVSLREALYNYDDPTDLNRNVVVAAELLLEPDPRFAAVDTARPVWAVRPDPRGLPAVQPLPDGTLPAIFVDRNGDGLADTDGAGHWVTADGTPFLVDPYGTPFESGQVAPGAVVGRDDLGRAFDEGGNDLFRYVDLTETPLGYLIRRTPDMVDRAILVDTFKGLEGFLGTRQLGEDGAPHYTQATPLLDLTYAAFQAGDFALLPELLEASSTMLRDHADTMATLLVIADHNGDINDRLGAELAPDNGFIDDLLPFVLRLAEEKGVLHELLLATQDPLFLENLNAIAELMTYYNDHIVVAPDGLYERSVRLCLDGFEVGLDRYECIRESANLTEIIAGEVDHSLPEGPGNTSLAQRLFHLVYDGYQTPFSMVVEELTILDADLTWLTDDIGPLLTIPDVDVALFDSIAGNFCLEDVVNEEELRANGTVTLIFDLAEGLGLTSGDDVAGTIASIVSFLSDDIGQHLDECPTPQQLIRFFNLPDYESELGPIYIRLQQAVDREGYLFVDPSPMGGHGDTLFAAEALGAIDGLYPLVKVFSDRGLSPLLAELIAKFYEHYPEPGADYVQADGSPADFAYSGIRRHEPAVIEIIQEGRFGPLLQELGGVMTNLTLYNGESASPVFEDFLVHVLDTEAGVTTRDGRTMAERGDGAMTPMNRFYLLIDAFDLIDAQLESNPAADEAWERAADELVDLMFETIETEDGRGVFEDPGSSALGTVLTDHLSRHVRRHIDAGDFSLRMNQDYPAYVENMVTSRAFAAAVDMFLDVSSDPEDQALFDDLLLYLTEEDETLSRAAFSALYDLLVGSTDSISYTQVAPFYAGLVDPDRRFEVEGSENLSLLTHGVLLLDRIDALDEDGVALDLLKRGTTSAETGDSPLGVVGDVIRQIHRVSPGAEGPSSAEDLASIYRAISGYIRDDMRGLERVFELVQDRDAAAQ